MDDIDIREDESKRAYLAGIMDGEAHIGIKARSSEHTNLGYRTYPRVSLNMSDTEDTRRVHDLFVEVLEDLNVGYSQMTCERYEENQREQWRIALQGTGNCKPLLEYVQSHLVMKCGVVEKILGIDWRGASTDPRKFVNIMKVRDSIREGQSNHSSKYDEDFFREEFSTELDVGHALEGDWS